MTHEEVKAANKGQLRGIKIRRNTGEASVVVPSYDSTYYGSGVAAQHHQLLGLLVSSEQKRQKFKTR